MDKEIISIKGDKDLWFDFVARVKKNRTTTWDVLKPLLEQYIRSGKQ